tara:strand:+ start:431 stop:724 length:294 start_codon:yes stop_codon:yes gene_type:complete
MAFKMKGPSLYSSPLKSDKDRLEEIRLTRERLNNKKTKKEENKKTDPNVKKYVPGVDGPKTISGNAPGVGVISKIYKTGKMLKHAYDTYTKKNTPVN